MRTCVFILGTWVCALFCGQSWSLRKAALSSWPPKTEFKVLIHKWDIFYQICLSLLLDLFLSLGGYLFALFKKAQDLEERKYS